MTEKQYIQRKRNEFSLKKNLQEIMLTMDYLKNCTCKIAESVKKASGWWVEVRHVPYRVADTPTHCS